MFATDIDEAQRQAQDCAAIDINLDGIEDGYRGLPTQSSDWAYLKGFAEGMKRRNQEMLEQTQYLKIMALRTDLIVAGHMYWINELMQDNDEPTLVFEEF